MDLSTKDTGKWIKPMAEEDLSMLTETSMMATGRTIRLMDTDNTPILMVLSTKDIGLMISNTVKEKNIGQMVPNTKVITNSERKMDLENSTGPTKALMLVNLLITIFMETENTNGLIIENMKDNGSPIRCTEEVSSHGPMEENMKVITTMTKKQGHGVFTWPDGRQYDGYW